MERGGPPQEDMEKREKSRDSRKELVPAGDPQRVAGSRTVYSLPSPQKERKKVGKRGVAPRSPPFACPPPKSGTTATGASGEPRSLPAPTWRGAHGCGSAAEPACGETFPPASALVPGTASPDLAPQDPRLPGPSGRRPSRASAPSVSRSRRPLPSTPIAVSGAQCPDQSPPSGTLFPPSFLSPFPPSISLPSTRNWEAAPKLVGRRPALRPCPLGDRTCHLRPPLGAHLPADALPLPPPPLPGTLSLRAPGDDSDLSSSSCSSGRGPAPPRSG
ncbi:hypothetical protein CapIbe_002432 [Capra ibex]